jgi:CheY-like chemotaxis protein
MRKRRESHILILGQHGSHLSALSERVRELDYRAIRAKTPLDALDLANERGFRFDAALIDPDTPAIDLASALEALRSGTLSEDLTFVATGPRPDVEAASRLRAAGVKLALWEPITDHALLFQLNRATTPENTAVLRAATRVPTEWRTRIMVAGRAKPARVYSLSADGAYLATERPSMRGAQLAIDLPLPSGAVSLLGQVLYTNVPGNLARGHLPPGMGICFRGTPRAAREALDRCVQDAATHYVV